MKQSLLKHFLLLSVLASATPVVLAGGSSTITRTVYFNFQSGISDVYFAPTSLDPNNLPTPDINYPASQMTISVTTNITNDISTADKDFNNGHTLAFNAAIDTSNYMDYGITGSLYINGDLVDANFNLSENGGNWWANSKASSLYSQNAMVGLDMAPKYGNRHYCLKQINYNTVDVYFGKCSSI